MEVYEKDEDSDNEFDTNWINKIEEDSKIFDDFFITENKVINLYIYYINRKNELYDGKQIKYNIENNVLKKSEIIQIIKKHMYVKKKNLD